MINTAECYYPEVIAEIEKDLRSKYDNFDGIVKYEYNRSALHIPYYKGGVIKNGKFVIKLTSNNNIREIIGYIYRTYGCDTVVRYDFDSFNDMYARIHDPKSNDKRDLLYRKVKSELNDIKQLRFNAGLNINLSFDVDCADEKTYDECSKKISEIKNDIIAYINEKYKNINIDENSCDSSLTYNYINNIYNDKRTYT